MTDREKLVEVMLIAFNSKRFSSKEARIDAALTSLEATHAVVPKEPTQEMVKAAMSAGYALPRYAGQDAWAKAHYKAMIGAAI